MEFNSAFKGLITSDPAYDIITKNRKICKSSYKCFRRVIERKEFATMFGRFHAEYFRNRLLLHNIHMPFCTLQEVIVMFRITMYMTKDNPLLHRFNSIITHMFEAGLFDKWLNNFMSSSRLDDHPLDDDDSNFSDFAMIDLKTDNSPFSLNHLQVVFYVLPIGQIISTFVFLAEVLYYRACITATNNNTLCRAQRDQQSRAKSL
jgi:hypothetical protein